MKELSEISWKDKAFVSRTIAEVESKGLIERDKVADSNERNYKIILSKKGKEFVVTQKKKIQKSTSKMLNGVTEDEIEIFVSILDKLAGKDAMQEDWINECIFL